jgi:GMP synthase (glutamine-hydrolysing)
LVVVMGGPQAVYRASGHPYLLDELRLLRGRLERGQPSLGICLGSQLLAAAAGARVYPGERGVELGLYPVSCTVEAAEDEVFSALPRDFWVLHWHGDTFDLPEGAAWLASTERYPLQAFRVGRSYGLQFHPELTGATFLAWADAARGEVPDRVELPPPGFPEGEPAIGALLDGLARFFSRLERP